MSLSTVPHAVYTIWWAGLIITLVVFVPLAVYLLHRTWRSARSIQRYAAETLQASGGQPLETTSTTLDPHQPLLSHSLFLFQTITPVAVLVEETRIPSA